MTQEEISNLGDAQLYWFLTKLEEDICKEHPEGVVFLREAIDRFAAKERARLTALSALSTLVPGDRIVLEDLVWKVEGTSGGITVSWDHWHDADRCTHHRLFLHHIEQVLRCAIRGGATIQKGEQANANG